MLARTHTLWPVPLLLGAALLAACHAPGDGAPQGLTQYTPLEELDPNIVHQARHNQSITHIEAILTDLAERAPTVDPAALDASSTALLRASSLGLGAGSVFTTPTISIKGVDQYGLFHAHEAQEVAPPVIRHLLANHDETEGILSRGTIIDATSLEDDHTLFKATLQLADEDAAALGVDTLHVALKPHAYSYYGVEYKRELAFYLLARHLGVTHGLVPIVEGRIAYSDALDAIVWPQLTEEQQEDLFIYTNDEDGTRYLKGTLQLWVEGYTKHIGRMRSFGNALEYTLRELTLDSYSRVESDPMWQGLSDMFVLDFLARQLRSLQRSGLRSSARWRTVAHHARQRRRPHVETPR